MDTRVVIRIPVTDVVAVIIYSVRTNKLPNLPQQGHLTIPHHFEEPFRSILIAKIVQIQESMVSHCEPCHLVTKHYDRSRLPGWAYQQLSLKSINVEDHMLVEFTVIENRPFLVLSLCPIICAVVFERICSGKAPSE